MAGHALGHAIPARPSRCLPEALQRGRRPWRRRLKPPCLRPPARRSSGGLRRAQPDCRHAQPWIDEPSPLPRGIPSPDAPLPGRPCPPRPPIVPGPARSVFALCDKPRFSEPPDALGLTSLLCHALRRGPPPLLLIPPGRPEKALQAPDAPPLDRQRHGLKGCPGQGAVVPPLSSQPCARASRRAQHAWQTLWHAWNSSMKPSTSLPCPSKVGLTNGSPTGRPRGNSSGLLRHEGAAGGAERAVTMRSRINGVVGLGSGQIANEKWLTARSSATRRGRQLLYLQYTSHCSSR
jgi:hypothetical protein